MEKKRKVLEKVSRTGERGQIYRRFIRSPLPVLLIQMSLQSKYSTKMTLQHIVTDRTYKDRLYKLSRFIDVLHRMTTELSRILVHFWSVVTT